MKTHPSAMHPIGIFDSGIGGLTVAHAVTQLLPQENIVYFGDTAHLPYGDKSASAIQAYAVKIAHMLLQQQCKLILIACHSASAAAYELMKEYVASKAVVVNVIDPLIASLRKNYAHKQVGLIGTKQTVNSNIYKKKIDSLNIPIKLTAHATNLLASAIEEFGDHPVIDSLLAEYLTHTELQKIDALVLACTHYPIIKKRIARFYKNPIEIIDPSDLAALAVKNRLEKEHLLNENGTGTKHFYVSDYTESFASGAKLFFDEAIVLEHYPLWE